MAQPDDIKHIVQIITKVAEQYLLDEIGVKTLEHHTSLCHRHELEMKPFAVMMEISGCFSFNIVFGFDECLIDKVYHLSLMALRIAIRVNIGPIISKKIVELMTSDSKICLCSGK